MVPPGLEGQESDKPRQREQAQAVEAYRRQRIWEETNAAYARLRSNPAAWQEEQEERQAWEATLPDGIDQ